MTSAVLMLNPAVEITGGGARRGDRTVGITDPFVLAALRAGVPAADVPEVLAGPARATVLGLHRAGMLMWRIEDIACAMPLATGTELVVPEPSPGEVQLSHLAVLRRGWVLESAVSHWSVELTPAALDLLAHGDPEGWLAGLLAAVGMTGEQEAADWSPYELLLLSRSRQDLDLLPAAARERGTAGEPARRRIDSDEFIALPRAEGPLAQEPSLFAATQSRRTVRDFAAGPVGLDALGALLWRTLRVQEVIAADPDDPLSYERVLRPVPSAGAMHATDLWLLCFDVESLAPGVYLYDPLRHGLVPMPATLPASRPPDPVVGVFTARHRRTHWKYGSLALSLELKDVGVQMMALQLSAPPLGLGVCPWGSGHTGRLSRILGIDPLVDPPVGEFGLGPLPE